MSSANAAPRDFLALHLADMAPHRAILRSIEAKFMSAVPLIHPVLDIGCGDGHFASIAYGEPDSGSFGSSFGSGTVNDSYAVDAPASSVTSGDGAEHAGLEHV